MIIYLPVHQYTLEVQQDAFLVGVLLAPESVVNFVFALKLCSFSLRFKPFYFIPLGRLTKTTLFVELLRFYAQAIPNFNG